MEGGKGNKLHTIFNVVDPPTMVGGSPLFLPKPLSAWEVASLLSALSLHTIFL